MKSTIIIKIKIPIAFIKYTDIQHYITLEMDNAKKHITHFSLGTYYVTRASIKHNYMRMCGILLIDMPFEATNL